MLEPISAASITGMAVSLAIAVILPVAAFIFWKIHSKAKWSCFFVGAGTFILFALILEQILHTIVLKATGTKLTGNIWLYALYGGLCAGFFEETGRLLAMKYVMNRALDRENAIMYGIGHGGIEAILIVGLSMVSNIVTAVMINNGQFEKTLNLLDEATRTATVSQISALWTTEPYLFYMGGVERISAFFLHIALSYLVYRAVKDGKMAYYGQAVFLHFLVDAVTVLLAKVLAVPVLEAALMVFVIGLWVFVGRAYASEAAVDRGEATASECTDSDEG